MAAEGSPGLEEERPGSASSWMRWDSYGLEWLFDPDRTDHLPIDEQLKLYQQRDLTRTKVFKFARRIWGGPPSRKRVINITAAEPSEREPRGGLSIPKSKDECENSKFGMDQELINAQLKNKQILDEYRNWMDQRKKFRGQLDSMGLNEEWLRRKPNKTAQEQRVLMRMIEARTKKPLTPIPVEADPAKPVLPAQSPIVRRPSPLAIKIIERFLHKKKLRLIDLFKTVDKRKSWMISKDDFRKAIIKAGIPLSDVLLEDLVLTLDTDLNNKLDYRELAKGLGLWKMEKRECKQQNIASPDVMGSPEKLSQALGFELPDEEEYDTMSSSHCGTISPSEQQRQTPTEKSTGSRIKSSSSSSSRYLEVPSPDLRPEQMVFPTEEQAIDQRIRDRVVLKRLSADGKKKKSPVKPRSLLIRTGDVEADRHLMPSTLTGDAAPLVNKFRQLKYREYNDVNNICDEDKDVRLSENLLKKVLLYPEDKTHSQLRKHIRQPAMPLLSRSDVSGTTTNPSSNLTGNYVSSAKVKIGKKYGVAVKV